MLQVSIFFLVKHTTSSYGVRVLTIPAGVWGVTEAVIHTATGEANGCKRIIYYKGLGRSGFPPTLTSELFIYIIYFSFCFMFIILCLSENSLKLLWHTVFYL